MTANPLGVAAVRPAQNPQAAWREIDGVVVVISPTDSVLHELNSTGSFIWKQANGERTVEEIAAQVAEEFDVSAEVALADTRAFLEMLAEKKLLAELPEAASA